MPLFIQIYSLNMFIVFFYSLL